MIGQVLNNRYQIAERRGTIEVALDGKMMVSYEDASPLRPGNIELENLAGTIWYDDLLICSVL